MNANLTVASVSNSRWLIDGQCICFNVQTFQNIIQIWIKLILTVVPLGVLKLSSFC